MTKKEFERLLHNKSRLNALKAEIDDMAYKSVVGSQQLTGMPFNTGTSDKVGDYATRITALEDKYMDLKIKQDKLLKRAKAFIREIPDETIASILYLKYIRAMDNLDIADELEIRGPYRERTIKKTVNTFFLDCMIN